MYRLLQYFIWWTDSQVWYLHCRGLSQIYVKGQHYFVWLNDVFSILCDVLTYVLTQWRIFNVIFSILFMPGDSSCRQDVFFDIMTYFQSFWITCDILNFDILTYFLMLCHTSHIFDFMTYFWRQYVILYCDKLFIPVNTMM